MSPFPQPSGDPAPGPGAHHDLSVLARALARAGYRAPHTDEPFTAAFLGGLGGGIGFMYFVFEYQGVAPITTIVTQFHPEPPLLLGALDRSGVSHELLTTTSARRATTHLHDHLRDPGVALCTVERAALPWTRLGSHPMLDGAGPTLLGVWGIDPDTAVATVDDDRCGPLPIDMNALTAARGADRKTRHQLVAIPPADGQPAPGSARDGGAPSGRGADAAVREALGACVRNMTEPVMGNNFDANFGLRGLRKWRDQLADSRSRQGWGHRYSDPAALAWGLRRIHDCLTTESGSPGGSRLLFADFLAECPPLFGGPVPAAAARLYRETGERWAHLARRAVSLGPLAAYAELATERRLLAWQAGDTGGVVPDGRARDPDGELTRVVAAIDTLPAAFADDPPSAAEVRSHLDSLAEAVDVILTAEEAGLDLLRALASPPVASR